MNPAPYTHYSHEAAYLRIADLRRAAAEHARAVRAARAQEDPPPTGRADTETSAEGRAGAGGRPKAQHRPHRSRRSRWPEAA